MAIHQHLGSGLQGHKSRQGQECDQQQDRSRHGIKRRRRGGGLDDGKAGAVVSALALAAEVMGAAFCTVVTIAKALDLLRRFHLGASRAGVSTFQAGRTSGAKAMMTSDSRPMWATHDRSAAERDFMIRSRPRVSPAISSDLSAIPMRTVITGPL